MSQRWHLNVWRGLAGCFLACAVLGCGSGSSVTLYPVSGEVKLDGKPLQVGGVTFYPDTSKGNQSKEIPAGEIKEGRYEIFTGKRRGAPPGVYKVAVVSSNFSGGNVPPPPTGGTFELPKSFIHSKYGDPRRTPLVVEVVAKPPEGAYDLKVSR
jgi:hypothetical protein